MDKVQKQINKLAKKYAGKKILIYGAGQYSDALFKNYDFSKLNIVGISDKKFETQDIREFYGYPTFPPTNTLALEFDVIVILCQKVKIIREFLEVFILKNNFKETIPLLSGKYTLKDNTVIVFEDKKCNACLMRKSSFFKRIQAFLNIYKIKKLLLEKRKELKNSDRKIKVSILIYEKAYWVATSLYRELENNPNFEVNVIVNPFQNFNDNTEMQKKDFEETYKFLEDIGIKNIIKSYDFETQKTIDLKQNMPDVMIYQAYWDVVSPELNIKKWFDKVLCIGIPYGFMAIAQPEVQFNYHFHNLTWINCAETKIHKKLSQKYADNFGLNTIVTGYPKMDSLYKPVKNNYWKINKENVKKLIYAPHFAFINHRYCWATFHLYYQKMFDFVKNSTDIEVVVKPHPLLHKTCVDIGLFTEEGYQKYIDDWNALPNASVLDTGEYLDLFKTSDAMILDSISFSSEYLFTNKPILFLNRYKDFDELSNIFNEYGKKSIENLYLAQKFDDIENFIKDVVIAGDDPKKIQRKEFFDNILNVNQGKVGKFIVQYIEKELGRA